MNKPLNNRAWFLVLPVLVLVAFSAVVPLMTVVNYSVQDSFGSNEFFWNGIYWFDDLLHSERMWNALGRQVLFTAIVLAIEVPLGIFIRFLPIRQIIGIGREQHGVVGLAGTRQRRNGQGLRPCGGAVHDRVEPGHVLGRAKHLGLVDA